MTIRHPSIKFGKSLEIAAVTLDNGLEIYVVEDVSAPVIAIQTWMGVGSRNERPGKTGISHLFEHLMFGATAHTPLGEYDRLLEEAGAEANAATFLDWTHYIIDFPKDALDLILKLEAERMSALVLDDATVAREKEVVQNERRERVEDDVDGSVSELLYASAFDRHSYRFPTIGTAADIASFTTADCMEFYQTYYAPNNAKLILVGDVSTDDVIARIVERYGSIPASTIPDVAAEPELPQNGERRKRVEKLTPTPKIAIGYRGPGMAHPDHVALSMLNEVLIGGRASRAYIDLVRDKELASDVRGWMGTFRDPSLYDLYLVLREHASIPDALGAFDALVSDLVEKGCSEAELDRAKSRVELGVLQGLETSNGKAEAIGFHATVLDDPAGLFARLTAYQGVTPADIQRVARHYLMPNGRTVVEVEPSESPVSSA